MVHKRVQSATKNALCVFAGAGSQPQSCNNPGAGGRTASPCHGCRRRTLRQSQAQCSQGGRMTACFDSVSVSCAMSDKPGALNSLPALAAQQYLEVLRAVCCDVCIGTGLGSDIVLSIRAGCVRCCCCGGVQAIQRLATTRSVEAMVRSSPAGRFLDSQVASLPLTLLHAHQHCDQLCMSILHAWQPPGWSAYVLCPQVGSGCAQHFFVSSISCRLVHAINLYPPCLWPSLDMLSYLQYYLQLQACFCALSRHQTLPQCLMVSVALKWADHMWMGSSL